MGVVELIAFTRAVIELAERHPVIASALLVLWVIGTAWKALPLPTRIRLELRYPRIVGALRVALFIGADVFGAVRTLYHQVIRGRERCGAFDEHGNAIPAGDLNQTDTVPAPDMSGRTERDGGAGAG